MKKLFLALSVFVLVCGAKALADFPGWNSEDVSAFLAQAQNQNQNLTYRLGMTVIARSLQTPVTSFAELYSLIQTVCTQQNAANEVDTVLIYVGSNRNQFKPFRSSLIDYLEPKFQPHRLDITNCFLIVLPDGKTKYTYLMQYLKNAKANATVKYVNRFIDAAIQIAINDSTILTVEEDLKFLNRRYSMFLLDQENRANWQPIVSKIRTMLQTY